MHLYPVRSICRDDKLHEAESYVRLGRSSGNNDDLAGGQCLPSKRPSLTSLLHLVRRCHAGMRPIDEVKSVFLISTFRIVANSYQGLDGR